MTAIISIVLTIIFLILSSFHFYWLFGGSYGVEQVIPTKENSNQNFGIPKVATLIVALILGSFALLYVLRLEIIDLALPRWITTYTYWIIPSIFTLRAIGDFKYVGFFKTITNTSFAIADSKYFSPLCLLIGILGFLMQLLN